jgi:uncharacterized cofD-like protein
MAVSQKSSGKAPSARAEIVPTPLRIVAIGGGTGLSTLLHGLKEFAVPLAGIPAPAELTAVVTVTDDGGSSGRLRRDFDVQPPGDIRNCMVALSEDEALLSKLFQYRFAGGRGLKGHSFGNLFLTALTHLTGDFATAVKLSSEVLASVGRIFPSTSANVALEATLNDGTTVLGESRISKSRCPIASVRLIPEHCKPLPETLHALEEADLISLGPGSLFTSIIPNLLVDGIPEAIRRSPAVKAYFLNLMWQPGETMHYTASDHVEALYRHAGGPMLDYILVNTHPISAPLRRRYAAQQAMPVQNDLDRLEEMGLAVVGARLLQKSEKVRHSPAAMANLAVELAAEGRVRREQRRASQA